MESLKIITNVLTDLKIEFTLSQFDGLFDADVSVDEVDPEKEAVLWFGSKRGELEFIFKRGQLVDWSFRK